MVELTNLSINGIFLIFAINEYLNNKKLSVETIYNLGFIIIILYFVCLIVHIFVDLHIILSRF